MGGQVWLLGLEPENEEQCHPKAGIPGNPVMDTYLVCWRVTENDGEHHQPLPCCDCRLAVSCFTGWPSFRRLYEAPSRCTMSLSVPRTSSPSKCPTRIVALHRTESHRLICNGDGTGMLDINLALP